MYNVLDVSRYIINYSNDKDYSISNLKLQKLLYFVQAYFLIETGNPCFNEKIEAWDFGPVVPEAYQEFKEYGCAGIPRVESYYVFDRDNIWNISKVEFDEECISKTDREYIEDVVDEFSDYTATDLVTITHKQSPWKNAYRPGENNEITIDSIRGYFNEE